MNNLIRCLIVFFLLIPSCLYPQWVQTDGPYGGTITSLAFADSILLAGTQHTGAYFSSDNGGNWIPIAGLSNTKFILGIATSGKKIIVSTDSGTYISKNCGLNWYRVTRQTFGSVVFLDTLLFATNGSSPLLSSDYGISWNEINSGLEQRAIRFLAISPQKSGDSIRYIYAATDSEVFVSTNNGTTWGEADSGIAKERIMSMGVSDSSIYVSTYHKGVYRSMNHGRCWSAANNGLPPAAFVEEFAASGTTIFAGTQVGAFRTTDNGLSWNSINTGIPEPYRWIKTIAVSPYKTGSSFPLIFIGTGYKGVFRSSDNGDTWFPVCKGLRDLLIEFVGTVPNSNGGNNIFAGSINGSGGLYVSTDNGFIWKGDTTAGLSNHEVTSIFLKDSETYAGTFGAGIFRSEDYGITWHPFNNGLPDLLISSFSSLGTEVLAGLYDFGLFCSSNNGDNWIDKGQLSFVRNGMIYKFGIYSMAVLDSVIFAGTFGYGIFRSTDNGAKWSEMNNGLTSKYINTITVSGTNIYIGSSDKGVFRSTDAGKTWEPMNSGLGSNNIYSLAISGENIFAGTIGNGVSLYLNNEKRWTSINSGLKSTDVFRLAVSDTYLYCATRLEGIWCRPLSEITGVQYINNNSPNRYYLTQNFPNPFNPTTIIRYQLPVNTYVTLKIYDILGREIAILVNERQPAGIHSVTLNAGTFSSGVYFFRLQTDTFSDTKKLILLK